MVGLPSLVAPPSVWPEVCCHGANRLSVLGAVKGRSRSTRRGASLAMARRGTRDCSDQLSLKEDTCSFLNPFMSTRQGIPVGPRVRANSGAITEARRRLIAAGFGAPLSAAAATSGALFGSSPDGQRALLAEIANYIGDDDPHMIGAAWLLEQCGFERSQLTLGDEATSGAIAQMTFYDTEMEDEVNDWEQRIEEKALWLRDYLAPLVGAKVTKVDVAPSGPYFGCRLALALANGKEIQLEVQRDEEGNGPGFLFGLENPGRAEDDSGSAQLAWATRYYAPLVDCEITKVDVEVDDDGAWPQISIRLADGRETQLEVSQDEEGNGPGFLAGLDRPDGSGA